MTEQVHRVDPVFMDDIGQPTDQLTVTNPRLERYGTDFITDSIDPGILKKKGPRYSIGECAKFFFGRSHYWIRYMEGIDVLYFSEDEDSNKPDRPAFVLDGERIKFETSVHAHRIYTLDVIERMAHALVQNGRLSGADLNATLDAVEVECRLHKLFS